MPKTICSIDGCDSSHKARGYCQKHYSQVRRDGGLPGQTTCTINACSRPAISRGLCDSHFITERAAGRLERLPTYTECTLPDCSRPHNAKGYCYTHYAQMLRGDAPGRITRVALTTEERFWDRVQKTESCWIWTGALSSYRYGALWSAERETTVKAHRWAYERFIGPLSADDYVDHTCFETRCVNPIHLRATTPKQNGEHRKGANSNSTTGVRGVYWKESSGKYASEVHHDGINYFLGYFDLLEDADHAAREKRSELFTHDDAEY